MNNITCIVLNKGNLKEGNTKLDFDNISKKIKIDFLSSNIIKCIINLDDKFSQNAIIKSIEKKFKCKLLVIKVREKNGVLPG